MKQKWKRWCRFTFNSNRILVISFFFALWLIIPCSIAFHFYLFIRRRQSIRHSLAFVVTMFRVLISSSYFHISVFFSTNYFPLCVCHKSKWWWKSACSGGDMLTLPFYVDDDGDGTHWCLFRLQTPRQTFLNLTMVPRMMMEDDHSRRDGDVSACTNVSDVSCLDDTFTTWPNSHVAWHLVVNFCFAILVTVACLWPSTGTFRCLLFPWWPETGDETFQAPGVTWWQAWRAAGFLSFVYILPPYQLMMIHFVLTFSSHFSFSF